MTEATQTLIEARRQNVEKSAQTIRGAFWHGQGLGGHNNYRAAEDALANLLAIVESGEAFRVAILHHQCNGCHAPQAEWGPICPGMTQGDATHFHSAEWWARNV